MITGAHSIIYSTDPDADRAFFRDILNLKHVDAGEGWLIFGIPCSTILDQGWGLLAHVSLPGGGRLGVYQPRHLRPQPTGVKNLQKKAARKTGGTRQPGSGRTGARRKKTRR